MTRFVHPLALLGVIAVPILGWFVEDWSGATTLAVYWFETVATSALIVARIVLHRRWSPRRGHFRYRAPSTKGRTTQSNSFLSGFALVAFAFSGAHALFLGIILFLLHRNDADRFAEIDWRSVGFGCLSVAVLLGFDFLVDLRTLRRWSFWQIETTANRALGRVVVVHLTLIFGLLAIAVTGVPNSFFGVFVVLKSMAALSAVLPQWEPATPPAWFAALMNRLPNVHPGKRFEEFWAEDRADETERRERNEEPWVRSR